MVSVLRAYRENRHSDVKVDYGPYRESTLKGARGPTTEQYFFDSRLLQTPVLQLRTPTWLADVKRSAGLSGHFVIGYPIMLEGWSHDPRVWLTKISAIVMLSAGGIAFIGMTRRFRLSRPSKQRS